MIIHERAMEPPCVKTLIELPLTFLVGVVQNACSLLWLLTKIFEPDVQSCVIIT